MDVFDGLHPADIHLQLRLLTGIENAARIPEFEIDGPAVDDPMHERALRVLCAKARPIQALSARRYPQEALRAGQPQAALRLHEVSTVAEALGCITPDLRKRVKLAWECNMAPLYHNVADECESLVFEVCATTKHEPTPH